MTEPLTPHDCDLRGLTYMQLDVLRLVDSDLMALSTGEEFKAAVTLWCKAWLQVPAASLPDDDRILAHLSGAGTRWRKVRDMALRGFVKCDDGRLYHPLIADKANEAFHRREVFTEKREQDRARLRSWRDKKRAGNKSETRFTGIAETPSETPANKNDSSIEREREREKEPLDKSSGGAAKRGTRLKSDFVVPSEWRTWAAQELGLSRSAVDTEAAKFVDYWHAKSGKDATKLDWQATWRNWCRNIRQPRPARTVPHGEEEDFRDRILP